jgi:hypothetical protein
MGALSALEDISILELLSFGIELDIGLDTRNPDSVGILTGFKILDTSPSWWKEGPRGGSGHMRTSSSAHEYPCRQLEKIHETARPLQTGQLKSTIVWTINPRFLVDFMLGCT